MIKWEIVEVMALVVVKTKGSKVFMRWVCRVLGFLSLLAPAKAYLPSGPNVPSPTKKK